MTPLLPLKDYISDRIPIDYWTRRLFDLPLFLEWLHLPSKSKVLELACHHGHFSRYLASKLKTKEYIAIDKDPQVIAKAEYLTHGNQKIIFQVSEATKLPFESNHFDCVISIDLLHHLSDWKKVIREAKRVLKKGGVLLIRDYSIESFTFPAIGTVLQKLFERPYDHMYDQVEFLTYLRKNGFEIKKQKEIPWLLFLMAVKV